MVNLFNKQNPNTMAIVADNTLNLERVAVKSILKDLARALIHPDAVEVVIKHGNVINAMQSGAINELIQRTLWYDVQSYLEAIDSSSPAIIKGKYMDAKHQWSESFFEGMFRMSLLRTEDMLVRLVFRMGLVENAQNSMDVMEKGFAFARNKFIKWVRENKTKDEHEIVKGRFDVLYVFRNCLAHALTEVARPGLHFRPNDEMLKILTKNGVNCEKSSETELTLHFEPTEAFFDNWRTIGFCHDYMDDVNGITRNPSLLDVIGSVEEIANKHRCQDKGANT